MKKINSTLVFTAIISGIIAFFIVNLAVSIPSQTQVAAVGSSQGNITQSIPVNSGQNLASQINGISRSLLELSSLKNTADNLQTDNTLVQIATQRKELMKELMKIDPWLFNAVVMNKTTKSKLPSSVQLEVEESITITGKITTIAIDDFSSPNNIKSYYKYYIQTPKVKYSFYPTRDTPLMSGTTVSVTGYVIDDQISTNIDLNPIVISKDLSAPRTDAVGNQRTLVLLIKAFPSDVEPFTPSQGQNIVFNSQFQNFMKEQSYDNVSFSGDVFGWISLDYDINYMDCYSIQTSKFSKAISDYNIHLENYDRIVYLFSGGIGGCSSIGKIDYNFNGSTYSLSQTFIGLFRFDLSSDWGNQPFTWKNLDFLLSHELGHALGVLHANSWACDDGQIIYGNCSHLEYGNYYDTMGTISYSLDYNAYFKQQLGWVTSPQVLSITHSGSYTINPIELVNGIKLATVNILGTTETPYFLEFRKGIGFDSNLNRSDISENQNGIMINRIQNTQNYGAPETELLDMSPTNDLYTIKTATLNIPSASSSAYSFVDAGRGITIGPVLNVSSSSITFNVTLESPTCQRFAPTPSYSIDPVFYNAAGSTGNIAIDIMNRDYYGCGVSQFSGSMTLPGLGTYILDPANNISIFPNLSGRLIFSYDIPITTIPGNYPIDIEFINKTSGIHKHISTSIQVSEPVRITSIDPSIGRSGIVVLISGTGFDPYNNMIFMKGRMLTETVRVSSVDGKIQYVIPNNVLSGNTRIPTPDGYYTIYIHTNGSVASTTFHVVGSTPVLPTITLTATPNSIASNQSTTISWSSTNATTCSNNPPGKGGYPVKLPAEWRTTIQPTSGSFILPASIITSTSLRSLTLYLSCTGPGGSASANVIVNVSRTVPVQSQTQIQSQSQTPSILAPVSQVQNQTDAAAQAQIQAAIQARVVKPAVLYAAGVPGDKNGTVSISGNNITITSLSDGLDWPMLTISWPASVQGGSACTCEGTLVAKAGGQFNFDPSTKSYTSINYMNQDPGQSTLYLRCGTLQSNTFNITATLASQEVSYLSNTEYVANVITAIPTAILEWLMVHI